MPDYSRIEAESIDHAAAARDAAYEDLKRRLPWKGVKSAVLASLGDAFDDPAEPLGQVVSDLKDCPLSDAWDKDGWLKHLPTRTKIQLGEMLLEALAGCQLEIAKALDDTRPF
jgi:hypothetical protein